MNALEHLKNFFVAAMALLGFGQTATAPVQAPAQTPVANREATPARFASFSPEYQHGVFGLEPLGRLSAIFKDSNVKILIRRGKPVSDQRSESRITRAIALAGLPQLSKNLESPVIPQMIVRPLGSDASTDASNDEIVCIIETFEDIDSPGE